MMKNIIKEVAGISMEARAWAKRIKEIIDQYNVDTYKPIKWGNQLDGTSFYNSSYDFDENDYETDFYQKMNTLEHYLTVDDFNMMDQDELDYILDKLILYYQIDYDKLLDMESDKIVFYWNNMMEDPDRNYLFEEDKNKSDDEKLYIVEDDKLIIPGKNFPDEYKNFSVDKWVIKDNHSIEYDHVNSGYQDNGEYVVFMNILMRSPSLMVLNHEVKHAFQDWKRMSTGHPPIRQSKELQQIYTKDFEKFVLSHPVGVSLNTLEGLIKGYYLTSTPEITAYLEGEYDRILGHGVIVDYGDFAKKLINIKVEDVEKGTKLKNLQKKWNEIIKNYNIPFFRKFKDVNDFIRYTVKFFNRRGKIILNKTNKIKYLYGKMGNLLNENKPNEIKYRIVSDYGYGDKSWVKRNLTKDEVKNYFIKYRGWSSEGFDEVGIEYFMDTDFRYYVEIDNIGDDEDWNWEDS